jgi:hypothetical protein
MLGEEGSADETLPEQKPEARTARLIGRKEIEEAIFNESLCAKTGAVKNRHVKKIHSEIFIKFLFIAFSKFRWA